MNVGVQKRSQKSYKKRIPRIKKNVKQNNTCYQIIRSITIYRDHSKLYENILPLEFFATLGPQTDETPGRKYTRRQQMFLFF